MCIRRLPFDLCTILSLCTLRLCNKRHIHGLILMSEKYHTNDHRIHRNFHNENNINFVLFNECITIPRVTEVWNISSKGVTTV
jgi:hypothetical protein